MELYTLNAAFQRTEVIDLFESLIWTERFAAWGDFDLTLEATPRTRQLLTPGTRLGFSESLRVMTVETREATTDSEGRKLLQVTGRSLEAITEERLAYHISPSIGSYQEYWEIVDTPGDVARYMFEQICVNGLLTASDIIPYVQMSNSLFPPDTIIEPSTEIRWRQKPDALYKALVELCSYYALGFRLVRNYDNGELHFGVYAGSDRRSGSSLPTVRFSSDFENLENSKEFINTQEYKNIAYVLSPQGGQMVPAEGISLDISGFDRRVMIVLLDDLDVPEGMSPIAEAEYIYAILQQKGQEALSVQTPKYLYDGETRQSSSYKYGEDYHLGDLVEVRSEENVIVTRRVTEQIFVSDNEGERSYPTLMDDSVILAETWDVWDADQVWDDFVDETWDTV